MVTIDWLTVGAQALNFLVLVYLLKRFLYGPVVRAIGRREEAIAERLREAEQRGKDAEAEARHHREAREALEAQRERLQARAAFTVGRPGTRQDYLRVNLQNTAQGLQAVSYANQSSGVLSSVSHSNALAIIPVGATVAVGDSVDVMLLDLIT